MYLNCFPSCFCGPISPPQAGGSGDQGLVSSSLPGLARCSLRALQAPCKRVLGDIYWQNSVLNRNNQWDTGFEKQEKQENDGKEAPEAPGLKSRLIPHCSPGALSLAAPQEGSWSRFILGFGYKIQDCCESLCRAHSSLNPAGATCGEPWMPWGDGVCARGRRARLGLLDPLWELLRATSRTCPLCKQAAREIF